MVVVARSAGKQGTAAREPGTAGAAPAAEQLRQELASSADPRRAWRRMVVGPGVDCTLVLRAESLGGPVRCTLLDVGLGGLGAALPPGAPALVAGEAVGVQLVVRGLAMELWGGLAWQGPAPATPADGRRVGLHFRRDALYQSAYVPLAMFLRDLGRQPLGTAARDRRPA